MSAARRSFAPGRVNLIGDHTDYAGGRALPMAISFGTTAAFEPGGELLSVRSERTAEALELGPGRPQEPGSFGAMASGVAELLGWPKGALVVDSDLPMGAGLSSSASLIVATALAMGSEHHHLELARLAQEAERLAGQDVGLLDQIAIVEGETGCATLIDFATMEVTTVKVPDSPQIAIVDSGIRRSLADGRYAERRREVATAEASIGPLGSAVAADLGSLDDPLLRRRARHVISECGRVDDAARLLASGDLAALGEILAEGHRSLRDDFEVSTPEIDALVERLSSRAGVYGARMTGGGFGGCLVVVAEPGSLDGIEEVTWVARPGGGARLLPAS